MNFLSRGTRKALVLSPAASHPQDFGNRRRVYQTCAKLKELGYEIHFLLYPMEPDWMERTQSGGRDMWLAWDSFHVIPSSRPFPLQSPAVAEYHSIDEWWDPTIGLHLSWLFAREHFDLFVVNYVFLSKAFEFADERAVKVLETHDRFAGRKELLTQLGARIEAFYTTEAQEKIALDRSDIVIAIKESEAEYYRRLTRREVIAVPFWSEEKCQVRGTKEPSGQGVLRVGFIGALNVVNVANMSEFLKVFEESSEIAGAPVQLDVAGDVCGLLESAHPQVRLLDRVETLEEFYEHVDVVVVPMKLSTGLKIKTGEALFFGKAVVATDDGFDGFPALDAFHCLESFGEVCRALSVLARSPERLAQLERRSRITARLARRRMATGYRRLAAAISRFQPTILFMTDRPVFEEENVEAERLAQWCQTCSDLSTTVVMYFGNARPAAPRSELALIDVIAIGQPDCGMETVLDGWERLGRRHSISEVIISVGGDLGRTLCLAAAERYQHITLDTWHSELAALARTRNLPSDHWIADDGHDAEVLYSMTALRSRPRSLGAWKVGRPEGALLVLTGPDKEDLAAIPLILGMAGLDKGGAVTLSAAPGAALDNAFFDHLKNRRKPAVIIAVGSDQRAVSVCHAVAALFGLVCVPVGSAQFPLAAMQADGTPRVCETYHDLLDCCPEPAMLARCAATHHSETGWHTYKARLGQRLSARRRLVR